jgi:hypothetical protein
MWSDSARTKLATVTLTGSLLSWAKDVEPHKPIARMAMVEVMLAFMVVPCPLFLIPSRLESHSCQLSND